MSSEVWNVTQNKTAQENYDSMKIKTFHGEFNLSDKDKLIKMTSICNDMSADFAEIEKDQQQYVIEIDNLEDIYTTTREDADKQISSLLSEIKTLEVKEQDGTITEEERKTLAEKKAELEELFKTADKKCAETKENIQKQKTEVSSQYLQKQNTALDYGRFTIQKGEPWANIDEEIDMDKKEFYKHWWAFSSRKAFKVYGLEAVEAGTNLVNQVKESGKALKTI